MAFSDATHPLIKQILIGRLYVLINGKLFVRIHFWVTFPDGIFLGWFGEICVLQDRVAIMVIALYRGKKKTNQLPGAPEPPNSPYTEEVSHFPPPP